MKRGNSNHLLTYITSRGRAQKEEMVFQYGGFRRHVNAVRFLRVAECSPRAELLSFSRDHSHRLLCLFFLPSLWFFFVWNGRTRYCCSTIPIVTNGLGICVGLLLLFHSHGLKAGGRLGSLSKEWPHTTRVCCFHTFKRRITSTCISLCDTHRTVMLYALLWCKLAVM